MNEFVYTNNVSHIFYLIISGTRNMLNLTEENILKALKSVIDPDLGKDIVTLGFVKNIDINSNNVKFELQLTTPACPLKNQFMEECEKAIKSLIENVGKIEIKITSNVQSHSRQIGKKDFLHGVKNSIAIASGKGGVGKSTIAANIALSLAKDGAEVGLLDADIYGPSAPLIFGIQDKPEAKNGKIIPVSKYDIKIMSIGFLIDPMDAVIWRGPLASGAIKQFMSDVDWGELDYLVFDLPPGTGDIQLTLVQTIALSGAVIITTPQEMSLADVRKAIVMFQKVDVPVLGLIENMSYFICKKCGHRENIFDSGGGKRTAEALGIPFLGEIPIETELRGASDNGKPIVYYNHESEISKIIQDIARNIASQISIHTFSQQ